MPSGEMRGGGVQLDSALPPCPPGGGGGYSVILVGHHKAHTFDVIFVLYIWVCVDISNVKEERYFGVGQSTRGNSRPRIKIELDPIYSLRGFTTILYGKHMVSVGTCICVVGGDRGNISLPGNNKNYFICFILK